MPETPLLAVRCPIDVLDQIESEKNLTGRSKTDVVIDRLRNSIPSLAVIDRHKLPAIAAIYQVFTSNNNLLYIGITDNLKQEWESHPLYGQFLESDVNSRITWYNSDLPVIDPNLVKKLNSVSDTVNTDRDSHSENTVSSDQLEYAIANSEIIKGIQSKLDNMELLLKLQREASIASPMPNGEPSPLPPLARPAIEDSEKKIIPLPDSLIVSPTTDKVIDQNAIETHPIRKQQGLSNDQLHKKTGIPVSTIEKWKRKILKGEKANSTKYPDFFKQWTLNLTDSLWYEID